MAAHWFAKGKKRWGILAKKQIKKPEFFWLLFWSGTILCLTFGREELIKEIAHNFLWKNNSSKKNYLEIVTHGWRVNPLPQLTPCSELPPYWCLTRQIRHVFLLWWRSPADLCLVHRFFPVTIKIHILNSPGKYHCTNRYKYTNMRFMVYGFATRIVILNSFSVFVFAARPVRKTS